MIFIDLDNGKPIKSEISVSIGDFNSQNTVYFVPDCKRRLVYCAVHPRQTLWYIKAKIEDSGRDKLTEKSQKEKFVD